MSSGAVAPGWRPIHALIAVWADLYSSVSGGGVQTVGPVAQPRRGRGDMAMLPVFCEPCCVTTLVK
ncbi:hypothetical protein ACIOK4_42825 [Streptomyces bottropensis]|uniref:hypothetical protein n=1 Tax=Streptomyces bottropensis TaxID=42235 RepID=UPI0037A9130B